MERGVSYDQKRQSLPLCELFAIEIQQEILVGRMIRSRKAKFINNGEACVVAYFLAER